MRFYTKQHKTYCGIALHARTMYLCILHQDGEIVRHRNMQTRPEMFLKAVAPDREDVGVCVEGILTWDGLADLCAQAQIPFVLGHALSMKALHRGNAKNDQSDAQQIAMLLRGGRLPQADVYPAEMRATRALRRRRLPLTRKRAALLAHLQPTNSQYNLARAWKDACLQSQPRGGRRAV